MPFQLFVILFIGLTSTVFADRIPELERYESCWKKFVGTYFDKNKAPYFLDVKSGHLSGTDACMRLLERGNLVQASGEQGGRTLKTTGTGAPQDDLGPLILRKFHYLHGSFLGQAESSPQFGLTETAEYNPNVFLFDQSGGSHSIYFTKHLFTPTGDYPFNKVFNDKKSYKALRYHPRGELAQTSFQGTYPPDGWVTETRCDGACKMKFMADVINDPNYVFNQINNDHVVLDAFGNNQSYGLAKSTVRTADIGIQQSGLVRIESFEVPVGSVVPFGTLVGVEENPVIIPPSLWMRSTGSGLPSYFKRHDGYERIIQNAFGMHQPYPYKTNLFFNPGLGALTERSQARGALFSDAEGEDAPQDGANRVPRKWSESFFKNVLCRDFPVIRPEDAVKYVDMNASLAETSFRFGTTCMGCHASMDGLSYIMRNLKNAATSYETPNRANGHDFRYSMRGINYYLKAFLPAEMTNPAKVRLHIDKISRPVKDDLFPFRLPDADFRFRDMHGFLHDVPLRSTMDDQFKSFSDLGEYLKDLDDVYACFASKYLNYLTGVKINPYDPGSLTAPKLSTREAELYRWLQSLSKDFKQHQSAKLLIQDIVSSEIFVDPQYGKIPKN